MPIFERYISSYSHFFGQNASKLHFLYPTKLVEYEYVKKNVEKFPNIFQRRIRPIFWHWRFNANFLALNQLLQNLVKMPQNITFLYPTKLVGYQYVRKKMLKKSSNIFQRRIKPIFLALELICLFLSLKSGLTTTFMVKMPQNGLFFIQLIEFNDIHNKYVQISTCLQ